MKIMLNNREEELPGESLTIDRILEIKKFTFRMRIVKVNGTCIEMIRFRYIDKVPPFLRNKYLLTLLIFVVWVLLLDSNNLIARIKEMKNLKKLKAEREYYTQRIGEDKEKLNQLKTDNGNLEKFAREQYRMKKPDEDLYVILTPREDRKITRRTNQ
jgi:cell division protein FtsB